jgi:hypothetical protein
MIDIETQLIVLTTTVFIGFGIKVFSDRIDATFNTCAGKAHEDYCDIKK